MPMLAVANMIIAKGTHSTRVISVDVRPNFGAGCGVEIVGVDIGVGLAVGIGGGFVGGVGEVDSVGVGV